MLDFRDLELLVALAQHGHFARAAESCGISQPAFSTRIRNLEQKLGAPMVKRGNRFLGFTAEGDIALRWARRVLQDVEHMRQDVVSSQKGLIGHVSVGCVPTADAFTSRAVIGLRAAHPGLTVEIRSTTSDQIRRDITNFALDAGVTYLETLAGSHLRTDPLYEERYVLIAPRRLWPHQDREISWRAAASLPLCLMSTDMNNRRILDQVFAGIGAAPNTVLETNAFTAALVQAVQGHAATIAPEMLLDSLPLDADLAVLALREPDISKPIGLVWAEQEPEAPKVRAILGAFRAAAR